MRNIHNAIGIGVQQVAGLDVQSTHVHRDIDLLKATVAVGHNDGRSPTRELQAIHLLDVTSGSAGNQTSEAETP